MATFLQLCNDILEEIDEDIVNQAEFSDTMNNELRRVKKYINNTYRSIWRKKPDWSWARNEQTVITVAGTSAYTPTGNLEKVHLVQIPSKNPMRLLSYQEAKREYGVDENEVAGIPYVAYVFGGELRLFPTPDNIYTVKVVISRSFEALSDYDDEPLIPDAHSDVLYHGGLLLAKNFENDADQQVQAGFYQEALGGLLNAEDNNHMGYSIIPEDEVYTAEIDERILLYD